MNREVCSLSFLPLPCIAASLTRFFPLLIPIRLRRYGPIPVEYSASFSTAYAQGHGIIVNISLGGCRAQSGFLIQEDDALGVIIRLPGRQPPLYIMRAITRW